MVAHDLTRLIYAAWMLLVVYLTVAAIGAKRDTQPHLGQSLAFMLLIIAAILLPRFQFVNFEPGAALGTVGLVLTVAGMGRVGTPDPWRQLEPDRIRKGRPRARDDGSLSLRSPPDVRRRPDCVSRLDDRGRRRLFLFLILTPLFLWRVSAEDALMASQFPREFPEYEMRTYALIPFVW